MSRRFYSFAIFFTGLYIVVSLFQSIIYFQLGAQSFSLGSFPDWWRVVIIIYLTWSFILLKYFHFRKYLIPFWTMIVYTLTSLCFFSTVYYMVVIRELTQYYIITYKVSSAIGIAYAISLIFSNAAKRPWLKTAGIFLFFIQLFLLLSSWEINTSDFHISGRIERILTWSLLAGSLIPVLFIFNFSSEKKSANAINGSPQESLIALWVSMSFLTFIFAAIFGQKWASDSLRKSGYVSARAKALAQPFEARTYVSSESDTLLYRFIKPPDYDPEKEYPLVVCLHHGGAHGADNIRQIEGSEPAQLLYANRRKYPAFLFLPQCPQVAGWGGIDSLVFETIDALGKEFKIDARRRYVTGISGGGFGSWHFITARPEMFAAAIPICGGGNPSLAKNIVNVPVWVFHGEKDGLVPVELSRDMVEAIRDAGGSPRYTEFTGAGHLIWSEVNGTPGLFDWLFTQKRD